MIKPLQMASRQRAARTIIPITHFINRPNCALILSGSPPYSCPCMRGNARRAMGRATGESTLLYFFAFFLKLSSTATATATVAPTIGLLPMPMRPIISTCAGTELEPANCASECMRPIVSVMP